MMNTTCYRLVVCEKPSVARSIAAVLGAGKRGDGFLSGGGYLVSWCFGHLAELSDADAYDEKYGKWRREDLPILPESWQYTVARDKQKQMNTLRALMHRDDVYEVVNACDAGREGELIFRTAYNLNNCRKRVKRLWISSMEDAAILQGFDNLRDGAEYDNLYASALCRSKADWLVGINATRLFSVMYHRTLNVGRVVSPTLALLVQREAEINAFQPETFYTVNLGFGDFSAASERMKEQIEAEQLAGDCNGKAAAVTSVVQTKKAEKAPALYDLTTLQRDANRLLGYTAQQTLDYLQSLYEKKLCTYPRTDSRYLTDDMEGGVNALALCCAGICGTEPPAAVCSGQVCSSKNVSDHHAVVPTMAAGETDLETLPAGEREILRLVSRQVLMAVSAPFVYLETEARLDCGGNAFAAKGKTILHMGWRAYTEKGNQDSTLPELSEGQSLPVSSCAVKEGRTTPPKHFTEDTLLSAMETAGKEDMPEDAERKGLGTPATRAAVIEKLVATGFAERRKAKKSVRLVPTEAGVSLITVLPEQLQSAAHRRMGAPPQGDRVRRAGRRRVPCRHPRYGRSAGSGRCACGRCGGAVPLRQTRCGQMPPLRRRGHGEQKRLFLRETELQVRAVAGQPLPCRQEDQPDEEDGFLAPDAGTRLRQRYLLRENRQDLRRIHRAGGRRRAFLL